LKPVTFENIIRVAAILCLILFETHLYGQEQKDTLLKQKDTVPKKNNNVFKFAIGALKRHHSDSATKATVLNTKIETPYLPYAGKVIRNIFIKEYGFERTFSDTSKEIHYFGTTILNKLHRNSREWVIRNNLFIKERTELNPYIVADNARYLRSIEFIQDARILVKEIPNVPDSVDLVVITKDLFSINGALNDASADRFKAKISDANVRGMGQKIAFTALIEKDRDPNFGYEILYSKNNIANTFINATVDYATIKPDMTTYNADEQAWYTKLERPLVSQYSHMAGAMLIGQNESQNTYFKPDSLFYKYHYNTFDAWMGYNLNVHKFYTDAKLKNRKFISLRYFKNNFTETPYQVQDHYYFRYNDRQAILGSITFFRQNFYETNYIYGFGTTEDIPYGYNVALTAGWYKQADLKRPYVGVDANRYVYTNRGDFIQYFLRTGGFMNHGQLQDASLLVGTSIYSRLFLYNKVKIRQHFNFSYTQQFNRVGLEPLSINNNFGLRFFRSDSIRGAQRISLYSETFFFLKYKVFGFKFAPFAFGDITLIRPEDESFSKSTAYYGLGGGVRTRNENLVFGTIELRLIYFPRKVDQNSFKLTLTTNIRFRVNSSYVSAPDIVQLNNDNGNNIY
jgi:hypothetical protein